MLIFTWKIQPSAGCTRLNVLCKKDALRIFLGNSWENICHGVPLLIKLQAITFQLYLKKSLARVFSREIYPGKNCPPRDCFYCSAAKSQYKSYKSFYWIFCLLKMPRRHRTWIERTNENFHFDTVDQIDCWSDWTEYQKLFLQHITLHQHQTFKFRCNWNKKKLTNRKRCNS